MLIDKIVKSLYSDNETNKQWQNLTLIDFKDSDFQHIFPLNKGMNKINVKFDAPIALQIDGETVLGVTEYTAWK